MPAVAFDTLKLAKRLKEAGFSEQQAEALAEAEAELFETTLATKQDIADLKREIETVRTKDIADLKREIETVRTKLEYEIRAAEQRMLIKLGSLMVIAVGVVATLVRLF